jgi:aldose sugar dehydrogenase
MALRALVVALLAGCVSVAAQAQPLLEDDNLEAELVVGDLDLPTTMAFIGDNDFFVLEKNSGQVIRVTDGVKDIVLDLDVASGGERGLLGIAVHPDLGAGMDFVYLYYTVSPSPGVVENRLDRFVWNGMNLVAPVVNLHTFPSFDENHNGGPLSFGPDGQLYGVIGDGQQNGPAQNNESASTFDDTGVIFRLDDDGGVPLDNPFDAEDDGEDPQDRYFAIGIRNSFGLGWDPVTGDLWDTENGADSHDEINHVPAGLNSGWRDVMGPASETPAFDPDTDLFELAGAEYADPAYSIETPVAVTGIAFASMDSSLGGEYEGDLFLADFGLGKIYDFDVNGMRDGLATPDKLANNQNELDDFLFASEFEGGITDLEEGPEGDLYVVAFGLGEVWRIRGGMATHDLAMTSLKPPKKVAFTPDPKLKTLKLSLRNLGTATETIADQQELDDLIDVTITSIGVGCEEDLPVVTRQPPKDGLPFTWAPNRKLTIGLDIAWDCINDPLATTKTEDHDDFTLEATVDLSALGEIDGDTGNDACPRAATADDKGCGKMSTPFRIDLYEK